jgi:hypothetical protein
MHGNRNVKFNKRPCVEYTMFPTQVTSDATAKYVSSLSKTDNQPAAKRHWIKRIDKNVLVAVMCRFHMTVPVILSGFVVFRWAQY